MSKDTAPSNIAFGVFDGVHLGHQFLIRSMVEQSTLDGVLSVCITLDPDPEAILHPDQPPAALSTLGDRVARIQSLRVGRVDVLPFSGEVARQPADHFVQWMKESYALHALWVGTDFALGRERSGTIDTLRELGRTLEFEVVALDLLQEGGRSINSTWIRELLRNGDVRRAAQLLGHPYTLSGTVSHGVERGRQLGFPTANIVPPVGLVLPADGVYFVKTKAGEANLYGVANLGPRPTFGESERQLETHLFDFAEDLYDTQLEVSFLEQLRPIRKFESVDELRTQIVRDIETARALLEKERTAL